jgi:RimJ/RimL family protein N-acetyltransferase
MVLRFRTIDPVVDAALTNEWRSSPRVERTLRTSFRHSDAQQAAFLERKNADPNYLHWIVEANGLPCCYLMALDYQKDEHRLSWGFWIGDESMIGLGALIPPAFYNHIFEYTSLEIIQAEVLSHNTSVLKMHLDMGYVQHDLRRNTKTHNMSSVDEHILWLSRTAWYSQTKSLLRIRAEFEIPDRPDSLWKRLIED